MEVAGSDADGAVIAFGDSITDGAGPAAGTDAAWPDLLYARLRAAGVTRFSVANAGIGGNRLLHPGSLAFFGDAGLARFDRDVLAQPNVRAVIILWASTTSATSAPASGPSSTSRPKTSSTAWPSSPSAPTSGGSRSMRAR